MYSVSCKTNYNEVYPVSRKTNSTTKCILYHVKLTTTKCILYHVKLTTTKWILYHVKLSTAEYFQSFFDFSIKTLPKWRKYFKSIVQQKYVIIAIKKNLNLMGVNGFLKLPWSVSYSRFFLQNK